LFKEENVSTSATHLASSSQLPERRTRSRTIPKTLIYVACGESNGGMVLNASDDGMAISMAIALGDESFSNLQVCMNGLPQAVEVHGRVMWTTKSKKRAGIQLVDLTEAQREQVHAWITLEGVRDVNLLPRTVAEEPAPDSPLASAEEPRALVEEPHSTLLDAFGGSPPESLGPTLPERFSSENAMRIPGPSQGFDSLDSGGFRDNEWDLAAVTMVPRKKTKPEGLSAFALMLLWIAIPSFGIGILVGRRPLQQWLARAEAAGRSFSTNATPESADARDKAAISQDQDAADSSKAEQAAPKSDNSPASADSARKSVDGSKTLDAGKNLVDPRLFNSMSTQEARAFRSSLAAPVAGVSAKEIPNVSSNREANSAGEAATSSRVGSSRPSASSTAPVSSDPANDVRPAQPPVAVEKTMKAIAPPPVPATSNVARSNGNENFPSASRQDYSDRATRTISVDSGFNSAGKQSAASEGFQSSRATSPPVGAQVTSHSRPTLSTSSASVSPARNSSDPPQNANSFGRTNPPVTPPTQQVRHSAARSEISASPTTASARNGYAPPMTSPSKVVASSLAPSAVASSRLTSSFAAGSIATPATSVRSAPSAAPGLAPVAAVPPLHGVMLVARKDEPYVLKLPVEAVAGDRGISIRMQRFVIVPRPSRWHRHGAIAKLTIGDLLTEVSPEKPEAKVKPQEGEVVTVRAFLDKYGSVQDLKPVSGRLAMMPRVMRALRNWQFDQTLMNGKPVESEVNVTVQFQPVPGR
jgi:hypothetical protein